MHSEEENIRKKLGNNKPQQGFKLPDNYFDTFSSKVKEGIKANTAKPKGVTWANLLCPVYSIPVAAMVIFVTAYFVFFTTDKVEVTETQTATIVTTEDIPTDDIVEYLAQNVDLVGLNTQTDQDFMLLALNDEEETAEETITITEPLPDKKDSTLELTDKEIEEFLLNDIDDDLFEIL